MPLVALLAAPLVLVAQLLAFSPSLVAQDTGLDRGTSQTAPSTHASSAKKARKARRAAEPLKPFSRLALGGGISLMGGNLQAATNLDRYMNLRGTGNIFNYTANNINVSGFNVDAKMNFATAGASVDYYPFPNHGLRLSPGVLFYNQNWVNANVSVANGTELTLNNQSYYSLPADPITGFGTVNLHKRNPAFTITTGWGNMIPRKGGHWSFPIEIGAALIDTPTIALTLAGTGCSDPANLATCVNMATDPTVQTNLSQQITKYQKDIDPLRYYPIVSFGVAYSFRVR
jgi:hypothetical protein